MHACQTCGCACYCGGDFDDCEVGSHCAFGCGCDGSEDDTGPIDCACGRIASMDACQQCGVPLCAMCSETGAGFCEKHPDGDYKPQEETA